jgi:hypothetical protein
MSTRVSIPYDHDSADLSPIYLAVTDRPAPSPDAWVPAFRDTVGGVRVVWAEFDERGGRALNVWVRDKNGTRAHSKTVV